jgi:hypothetical protein
VAVALYMIVEGDTEERFANQVLVPHLAPAGVCAYVSKVVTKGRRGDHKYQGGGRTYGKWRNDLTTWIKQQEHRNDVWFTTMLDLYGLGALKDDFPEYAQHAQCPDPRERVRRLEEAWSRDVPCRRFIPYLQLHEFEALVLVDVSVLGTIFIENADAVAGLVSHVAEEKKPPELINDGLTTCPSRRIIRYLPGYENQKADAGSLAAKTIGLPKLRQACPHFNDWLTRLENLDSCPP